VGSSGGGIRYSTGATASASLTFTGASITWYTWKTPSGGIVNVYVDGVLVKQVDNYSEATQTGVVGYKAELAPGPHTIKITASGKKNPLASNSMTHFDSFVVGSNRSGSTEATSPRLADCPAATVNVANTDQLTKALKNATAGTVIRLKAGSYKGGFALSGASGTAAKPIWLCGSSSSVLETGSIDSGTALRISGSSHVRVAGLTVARSLQGIMVSNSSNVVVTDAVVKDIGYEGVHFYVFTTDSTVQHTTIARTGSVDMSYGEGVYIGTSPARWNEVTKGAPDASDRNRVLHNTISTTGAEGVEAKAGTTGGVIEGNTFKGSQPGSWSLGWVLTTGNDWKVGYNTGATAVENAYASMAWTSDWGNNNSFYANSGAVDSLGYGVWVHDKKRGVTVTCDNVTTGAALGDTNVFCTP
jgi:hypothetical protein